MVGLGLTLANALAFALLLWQGDRQDRIAAALLAVIVVGEAPLATIEIGTWPVAVAGLNLLLFLGLWRASEQSDRWWIFLAGAIQLLIVCTHLMPLMSADYLKWTLATVRLGLWSVISILMFGGAWEARADRRFRLEGLRHGDQTHIQPGL